MQHKLLLPPQCAQVTKACFVELAGVAFTSNLSTVVVNHTGFVWLGRADC